MKTPNTFVIYFHFYFQKGNTDMGVYRAEVRLERWTFFFLLLFCSVLLITVLLLLVLFLFQKAAIMHNTLISKECLWFYVVKWINA